ncbi:hypothetical protein SE17_05740 [Kouleothrix aurantiaca]|uniref:Scaffolding protein n=1 Tax=Kouleothrix aurantiaca TaxID=186479 RepID=A0A0N8PSZ6_9CHLR|nr:hypothetical protein SE17_05740 [Kouleothrix aurantiaca]
MAENETNVVATPDEPGNNDANTEGVVTQTTQPTEAPKSFSQDDLDRIVKSRLAENARTLKTKFEKDLEAQIAATREEAQKDLDKLVDERVNSRLAERELAAARTALAEEYGLNEDQISRLVGTTPDELKADAAKVFGGFKKVLPTPPVIQTGNGAGGPEHPVDINKMTPAQIRANRNTLLSQTKIP